MNPYYEEPGLILYHGDAMEIVPALTERFDSAICDPPYAETSLDWDIWPGGWPAIAARVTNSLWCFGSMRMFLDRRDEFTGWKFAQDIVWEKHNGSGFAADRFKRVHECACHFYNGEWEHIFHDTPTTPDATPRTVRTKRRPIHMGQIDKAPYTSEDGGPRLQRSVIYVRSCHGYAVNETQKPEGIVAPLTEYSVPPGGSVLDMFAGSGTVLAVARQQGKRCVAIEKRESQCEEIVRRLAQGILI